MTNLAACLASRTDEPVALAVLGTLQRRSRLQTKSGYRAWCWMKPQAPSIQMVIPRRNWMSFRMSWFWRRSAGPASQPICQRNVMITIDLDPDGQVIVACDPLDGSSNIGVNLSVGTIFSVLPADRGICSLDEASWQQAMWSMVRRQRCWSPLARAQPLSAWIQTACFSLLGTCPDSPTTSEFAINMSNHRHWQPAIRRYVDGCLAGEDGDRAQSTCAGWRRLWRMAGASSPAGVCFSTLQINARGMKRTPSLCL